MQYQVPSVDLLPLQCDLTSTDPELKKQKSSFGDILARVHATIPGETRQDSNLSF